MGDNESDFKNLYPCLDDIHSKTTEPQIFYGDTDSMFVNQQFLQQILKNGAKTREDIMREILQVREKEKQKEKAKEKNGKKDFVSEANQNLKEIANRMYGFGWRN